MNISIDDVSGRLTLHVSTEWLDAPAQEHVRSWLDAHDVTSSPLGPMTSLTVERDDWLRFGTPPPSTASAEEVDIWVQHHAVLGRLLGVRAQAVHVSSVGHVGSASFSLKMTVDGLAVDLACVAPVSDARSAERAVLLPFTAHVRDRIRAFLSAPATRPQQLAFVAELHGLVDRAAKLFDGAAVAVSLQLDEHLATFTFERVERAALTWSGKGDVFSLGLEGIREDGSTVPLPLGDLDKEAPLLSSSGKKHVLLDEEVAHVARVAKGQRNKLRKQVADVLNDPARLLPSGWTYESIDLSRYSPRIAGFVPVVRADRPADIRSSGTAWYSRDDDTSVPFLRVEVAQPDGTVASLDFPTPEEARSFVERGAADQKTPIRVSGHDVIPTAPLVDKIREDLALYEKHRPDMVPVEADQDAPGAEGDGRPAAAATRLAAVIRDVDQVRPLEGTDTPVDESIVPWAALEGLLQPGISIKPHQRQGIAWMWQHYNARRHGVLLADDMGLGKTLQLACVLALLRCAGRAEDQKKPSLVVAPVILLETWVRETRKFFRPEVFESTLVLHDGNLRRRVENGRLNTTGLDGYAFIFTNYDTLARYQQQLLALDYAAAVFDEAQAVKNPDALRTLAARGLKRSFAICSTGTPVENRLLDLWTLYEVLSPGQPFGSRADFERTYEADPAKGVAGIREALRHPSPMSTLLRRTKREVLQSLPPKHERVHPVAMTEEQLAKERIVTRGPGGKRVLETLHSLQKLYQHPRLLMRAEEVEGRRWSVQEIVEESPKLRLVIELLTDIRAQREKALVFTLWTGMQELLSTVLKETLGLGRVRVINGETNGQKRAQQYLDEFERTEGFDVLILSPLAAGTGLTITSANHVIHYGRWWNPAKEDQATDRAYRIGQTKPVYVHYPVLHHPGREDAGFDMKLHELVGRKREMARDFLDPSQTLDISEGEFRAALSEEDAS